MSRCYSCGKQLTGNGQYHSKCLEKLFENARLPSIPFGLADLPAQVSKTGGRMSISGMQMKLSVLVNPESLTLETVAEGGTHILKPGSNNFPELPQNENLCMNLAAALNLSVPPHGLFTMADGNLCYVIKRFDRLDDGTKLHKETMYQILNAEEKYRGSLEQIGKMIHSHTYNVGLDSIDFFERVLLSFLIGNGDMHLKNWAFLINDEGKVALAPCYDFVSSKIYIQDEEDSALSINGRKNKLRRADFETLADSLRIDPTATENSFQKLYEYKGQIIEMTTQSELSATWREKTLDVINSRYKRMYQA